MSGQLNDLEEPIYQHLSEAAKIGDKELQGELAMASIATKSYHIKMAAEAAEIAGWPRNKIATRLWELVEKHSYNISRRLIQCVCSPLGYVDETQDKKSDAIVASENSSIYEIENADAIDLVDSVIAFLKDVVRKKLSGGPFLSSVPKNIWLEHKYTLESQLMTAYQCWDGRYACPVIMQYMLLQLIIAHSVAGGAEMFLTQVKKISLTPKQATKYRHGEVMELLPIYDPKNREEAILAGFYGQQCACGSWRVKLDKEATDDFKLHCFACLATFEPVTLKLPIGQGIAIDSASTNDLFYQMWKNENKIG